MSLRPRETEALNQFTEGCRKVMDVVINAPCHPSDKLELIGHIHAIQNLIMARSAVRADPGKFTHVRSFCSPPFMGDPFELCTETHE